MKIKKLSIYIGVPLLLIVIVFFCGPRPNTDFHINSVKIPDDVEKYISDVESRFDNIQKDREKKIFWASGINQKTDISIIYFHGFPSSRLEQSPVFENIAKSLGANIYFARFTGHGREADDFKEVTLNDWYNDAWEAWEIGKKIGDEVIIVSHSNGAPISAWLCSNVAPKAWIMTSPNFKPANPQAELIGLPWSKVIVKVLIGDYYDYKDKERLKKLIHFCTFPYHSDALQPMYAGLSMLKNIDFSGFNFPILCLYTETDTIVSVDAIKRYFNKLGSSRKQIIAIDKADHNLCGDVFGKQFSKQVEDLVVKFIKEI